VGADSTFSKGDLVDRFEISELIAEGGMGAIYRAIDTKLRKTVALKVVRADRLGSTTGGEARQRFLREALAISKVDHRNVVRVLDFGFSNDTPYLAMEYLRGRDLGKLVKATAGFLPISEIVDVMLGVCAAVRACHDAGIIHRDLKPSNVFLCEGDSEREVKILDFGVSKAPIAGDLTREGQILGTPQYLAPEQVDGKAVPQTDQYAIGVMLYLCLTKKLPYHNHGSLGLLRAILVGKFAPPRTLRADLPEKLEAIVLRAMRIAPEERFESVHALGRELWEFASPEARERWRSYYVDPLRAPPKASTHAMPLIEVLARGIAVPTPSPAQTPARDPAGFAPTEAARAVGPEKAVTPDAAPVAPTVSTATQKPGAARPKRRTFTPLIVVVAVALAAAGLLTLGRRRGADSPTAAAPATSASPAPSPARVPPVRPPAEPPRAAPPPTPTPSARRENAPRDAPAKRAEKRHRRNNHRPMPEQTADGVPIMP
jgi:eukaryotic-like serine/threonine-protein kinase